MQTQRQLPAPRRGPPTLRRCDLYDVLILPDGTRVMINIENTPTEEEFRAQTEGFYSIVMFCAIMTPICMAFYAACKHGWI